MADSEIKITKVTTNTNTPKTQSISEDQTSVGNATNSTSTGSENSNQAPSQTPSSSSQPPQTGTPSNNESESAPNSQPGQNQPNPDQQPQQPNNQQQNPDQTKSEQPNSDKDKKDQSEKPKSEGENPEANPNAPKNVTSGQGPAIGNSTPNGTKGINGQTHGAPNLADTAHKSVQSEKTAAQKKAVQQALKAIGEMIAKWLVAVGWPVFAVLVVVLLIVILFYGSMTLPYIAGYGGKSSPVPSGPDYANAKTVVSNSSKQATGTNGEAITGHQNLELNATDKKFIADGKADKRVLDLLNYENGKHTSLGISHVVEGYQNMSLNQINSNVDQFVAKALAVAATPTPTPINESGSSRDSQITNNVSAHKEGLAIDINTIDYVYKVDEESQTCQQIAASACGPFALACKTLVKQLKLGNLVYYSDKNNAGTTTTSADPSLDSAATTAKIAAQKIILDQSKATLAQAKTDLDDLKNQLEQTKTDLQGKLKSGSVTTDQRAQIQAQIARIQDITSNSNGLFSKVDSYNQQMVTYNQRIVEIQQKSVQLKNNLETIKALNNKLGTKKNADVDRSINNMLVQLNKITPKLETVSTQIQSMTLNVTSNTTTMKTQVQDVVTKVSDTSNKDTKDYLNKIDSAIGVVAVANNMTAMDTIAQGQSALDSFVKELESLIQASANQALDQFKVQLEQQLKQAINDQLNTALSGLGLGGLDSNALLFLPCVGFVVPTTSIVTGINLNSGIIDGYNISKLSQDITSNVNKVNAQITKATGALNSISAQISAGTKTVDTQMQNFSNTFSTKVQELQTAVNKTNLPNNTYLNTIDQNIGLIETIKDPTDLINQYKSTATGYSGQLTSIGQGAIDQVLNQTSPNTNTISLDSLKKNIVAQKDILSQSKTNADQTKTQLADLLNKLKQTKVTLQTKSNDQSLTSIERAKVQAQISKVQIIIDKTNTFKNQIDTYMQQVDSINQKISDAEQGLTQVANDLNALKDIVNQVSLLPIKLDGLIAKFIPGAMMPYAVVPNTKYQGNANAQAVPIQVKWQDDKPDAQYVSNESDDKSLINAPIFYTVYRPEARRKVHQLIQEILQFPYDMNNIFYYHVTQLITFSDERDVQPFMDTLKALYGYPRPSNYGLFAMPESWAQVHVGY